jgi:hypothetical protein
LPEIVITVARYGFLVLLWIFVFTVVGVIRRDLFSGGRANRLVAMPRGVATSPVAGRPAKVRKGRAAHQLIVTAGALAGTALARGGQITIGRAEDSTLVITDIRFGPPPAWYPGAGGGSLRPRLHQRHLSTAPGHRTDPVPLGVPIRISRRPSAGP